MAVPYFINPTAGGRIQPHLEAWDGKSIRVTRTCGPCGHPNNPHGHSKAEGCAVDLGDGKCTRAVVAVMDGTIAPRTASMVLQGIVIINHADGWRTDYSHMFPVLVKAGQLVKQGQQIGEIGDAHDPNVPNFSGCHLHYNVLHNGAQQDPAGYLNMPPPVGEDMIQGTNPVRIVNRATTVKGDTTNFRAAPTTTVHALVQLAAGTPFQPNFQTTGSAVGSAGALWYAGFLPVGGQTVLGYMHSSVVNALTPIEQTTGITPEQLAAEKALSKAEGKAEGVSETEGKWENWNSGAQAAKP